MREANLGDGIGAVNSQARSARRRAEAALLLGAIAAYLQRRPTHRTAIMAFGVVMLSLQGYVFFSPPPASPAAAASTALAAYGIFALVIWFIADRRPAGRAA